MATTDPFIDFPIFRIPEFQIQRDRCRGENEKKVLVLAPSDEDTEVLQTFLTKILGAAGLDLQKDVLLFPVFSDEDLHLRSIIQQEDIQTVVSFGIAPSKLGVHTAMARYQPVAVGGRRLLFAHSLLEIQEERQKGGKEKAGALWRALQHLFLEG